MTTIYYFPVSITPRNTPDLLNHYEQYIQANESGIHDLIWPLINEREIQMINLTRVIPNVNFAEKDFWTIMNYINICERNISCVISVKWMMVVVIL